MKHQARRAGFYERLLRRMAGQFITRESALENPRAMTHLLQRVPGLTAVKRGSLAGTRAPADKVRFN